MKNVLDSEKEQELVELVLSTFPDSASKAKVEIYYGDGYAEFPSKYYDNQGDVLTEHFSGWESPQHMNKKKLVRYLSDITDLRDGVEKNSEDYWNHCLIVVTKNGLHDLCFSYQPELDVQEEAKVRESIGDELYEQYERERKDKAAEPVAAEAESTDPAAKYKKASDVTTPLDCRTQSPDKKGR